MNILLNILKLLQKCHVFLQYLKTKIYKFKFTAGFTLVELLVVIAIMTIITSVIMVNHNDFASKVLLRNVTYDLALTIREAQVFGTSGRFQELDTFGESTPIIIYFDRDPSSIYSFYIFKDLDNDLVQDGGEFVAGYNLGTGYSISDIKADGDSITNIEKLAIRFQRPEPDAQIINIKNSNVYPDARIIIMSSRGEEMSVFVGSTGQISVQRIKPADIVEEKELPPLISN